MQAVSLKIQASKRKYGFSLLVCQIVGDCQLFWHISVFVGLGYFQEYETLWKAIYILVGIAGSYIAQRVYLFQTLSEFQMIKKGSVLDFLIYSLPFAIVFLCCDLTIHYLFDDYCLKHYLTEQKYEGEARPKRAYTIVKWIYSLFYYSISSIVAYQIIKPTSMFPSWLGGDGYCTSLFTKSPVFEEDTELMKIFYMFQLGKHFARLFSHMFIRPQGNYYEYVLHHALSTFLIIYSYLINEWLIGILVLFLHDTSDFFLILARAYRDYKKYSKKALSVIYVLAFFFWISCRLIVFPACCVYPSLINFDLAADKKTFYEIMYMPIIALSAMLTMLFILQIFWTYYIAQSFLSVNVTKKVTHNYD